MYVYVNNYSLSEDTVCLRLLKELLKRAKKNRTSKGKT